MITSSFDAVSVPLTAYVPAPMYKLFASAFLSTKLSSRTKLIFVVATSFVASLIPIYLNDETLTASEAFSITESYLFRRTNESITNDKYLCG